MSAKAGSVELVDPVGLLRSTRRRVTAAQLERVEAGAKVVLRSVRGGWTAQVVLGHLEMPIAPRRLKAKALDAAGHVLWHLSAAYDGPAPPDRQMTEAEHRALDTAALDATDQQRWWADGRAAFYLPMGRSFRSTAEVREYVESVTRRRWWRDAASHVDSVTVVTPAEALRAGRGTTYEGAAGWVDHIVAGFRFEPALAFRREGMKELIVLHELAHVLSGFADQEHGRVWLTDYVHVVTEQMGELVGDLFRQHLKREGTLLATPKQMATARSDHERIVNLTAALRGERHGARTPILTDSLGSSPPKGVGSSAIGGRLDRRP